MAVLIDASILIEAERGRLELEPHVAQRQEEEFFLSVITASELLHGVHRAVQPEIQAKRSAFVEAILARFPLLPVDLATARAHAHVWATLAAAGMMIGPHDLWLAATCLAHGLTMVTANIREFTRVPGLAVEVWDRSGQGIRYRVSYPEGPLKDLIARAGITGERRLLDLACGPGRIALALVSSFQEVWAIDREAEMVEVGQKEARQRGVNNIT